MGFSDYKEILSVGKTSLYFFITNFKSFVEIYCIC